MTKILTSKGEINTGFPDKKFREYLNKLGLELMEDMSGDNVWRLIKLVFDDFKDGVLGFDDFCSIGNCLFGRLSPELKSSRLGSLLMDIWELSFYVRQSDSEPRYREVGEMLVRIEEYLS
jgi:hypothetical protein